jgi:hypothetical protein
MNMMLIIGVIAAIVIGCFVAVRLGTAKGQA